MNEVDQISQAIQAIEAQRSLLGDAVVDTALAPLRDKLASLQAQPGAEQRKLVTILFSDLVGFTALSSTVDPEDLHHIINHYFKEWASTIEKYGGTVEKYIGDAVMAVFGLPVTHEDDPERAIGAALEMRQALERMNLELKDKLAAPIAMRTGIHTGPVMVSMLGERKGQDFVVVGDAVNLASRLQSLAPSGGIIISHDTYRLVRGLFDVEVMEPAEVKGKAEPVQAYLVTQAKQRAFHMGARGLEGIETRMFGRRAELQTLQETLQHTQKARETRVLLVVGEAGIGKTRLMAEFEQWVDLQPQVIRYFKGRASPYMQNLPLSLLREVFSFRFQILDSDSAQVVQEKIERGLSEFEYAISPDETRVRVYLIARLLGYTFDHPAQSGIPDDPRILHERAAALLVEYFQLLGAVRPIVILLEDLHWADDSTLNLLTGMIHRLPNLPLLVVCTARPAMFERLPDWGKDLPEGIFSQLNLSPLSQRDNIRLVNEILKKVEHLPHTLRKLIVKRAEGNPFFTEELIKMLIEDGVIQASGERWEVNAEQLASVRVPPTLIEVLQARFESLSQEERILLQRASVLGRIFWDEAIVTMERGEEEESVIAPRLDEVLERLSTREMIFPQRLSTFTSANEYHFKHALQRDVTYESVLKRLRRVYHAYAAAWLQEVTQRSQRTEEYAALIAEHYDRAGDLAHARDWYLRAGDLAAKNYANAEALHCFTRCLQLWPDQDLAGKAELLFRRVQILDIVANRQAQQDDLAALTALVVGLEELAQPGEGGAALENAAIPSRQARLALEEWQFCDASGNSSKAIAAAQRAVEFARKAGDRELEARAFLYWGAAAWKLPDFEMAKVNLEQALDLARQMELAYIEGDCLRNLGIVAEFQGDYAAGEGYYLSALQIYQETGNERGVSMLLNSLGSLLMVRGDFLEARASLERSLVLKRKLGNRRGEIITLHNLGVADVHLRRLLEARQYLEQVKRLSQEIQDPEGETDALMILGIVSMRLGDFQSAGDQLEQSITISRSIQAQTSECDGLIALANLAIHQERYDAVHPYCQAALSLARELSLKREEITANLLAGRAWLGAGDFEPALQVFSSALAAAEELGVASLVQEARAGSAQAHLAAGQMEPAQLLVEQILSEMNLADPAAQDESCLAALESSSESFWVLDACCQALAAGGDRRADALLDLAARRLHTLSGELGDERMQHAFLALPVHRSIVEKRPGIFNGLSE